MKGPFFPFSSFFSSPLLQNVICKTFSKKHSFVTLQRPSAVGARIWLCQGGSGFYFTIPAASVSLWVSWLRGRLGAQAGLVLQAVAKAGGLELCATSFPPQGSEKRSLSLCVCKRRVENLRGFVLSAKNVLMADTFLGKIFLR